MRLNSFRIRNFRSIVDTGWQSISPDNITCLIGQNESGKTSVLEGLLAFSRGEINEDILRSDLSLPEVSCRFEVPDNYLLSKVTKYGEMMEKLVSTLNSLTLVRSWKADLSSEITIGGEIFDFLNEVNKKRRSELDKTVDEIRALDFEINVARDKIRVSEEIISDLNNKLADKPRKSGLKLFRKKSSDEGANTSSIWDEYGEKLQKEEEKLASNREFLDARSDIVDAIDNWNKLQVYREDLTVELENISSKLEERHQTMTLLTGPTIKEMSRGEWEHVLKDYKRIMSDLKEAGDKLDLQTLICRVLFDGKSYEEALPEATRVEQKRLSGPDISTLGELFVKDSPVFEMFEDFGSLLPNRIDMEDIITENDQVEGYKAARNFLTIARLDYSFFQQPSSRILKQKIENLNAKLTLDFQDFWQQYVGHHNKIRINFELDHYSTSHGDKAGKPFLEFWVKDEGERLYPKQRSRGVRWFLSFYLELMAASERENRHRILLVDEPGVSLHARAQEDVLKVFEDIKDNIQVIYTTHSPNLVDINKLHRVLAIQRDDIENQRSATTVLDAARLADASPDTLSPLQSIMGNPVGNQEFSVDKYNIIINNIGTFYVMTAALKLTGYKGAIHFIPANDASSIPLMCNILMGWGMRFAVLLFNNEEEKAVRSQLKETIFTQQTGQEERVVMMPEGFADAEDLFSTLDFKKYILRNREGITVSNSDFVTQKQLPRNFLMSKFLSDVNSGKITRESFDEESRENLMLLLNVLQNYK